jgi:DNA-3-methyladenine glycosylase II
MTEPVDALRASDPILASLMDGLEPVDLRAWRAHWSLDPFRSLARAIVGQQIATRAATAIFDRLQGLIGDRDPATAIAAASDQELRSVGLSAAKAASLRDLAARTLDGRLELDRIDDLTDDEAKAQLTAVRGIGAWTAEMFLLGQLGRPDILPAGDLGIRHAVKEAYGLDHVPSEGEVRAISEPWRPNRSLATAYLYRSLRRGRPPASEQASDPGRREPGHSPSRRQAASSFPSGDIDAMNAEIERGYLDHGS